jgi:hypothetical protein
MLRSLHVHAVRIAAQIVCARRRLEHSPAFRTFLDCDYSGSAVRLGVGVQALSHAYRHSCFCSFLVRAHLQHAVFVPVGRLTIAILGGWGGCRAPFSVVEAVDYRHFGGWGGWPPPFIACGGC